MISSLHIVTAHSKNDDHCLREFDIAKQLLTRHSTFTHFIH